MSRIEEVMFKTSIKGNLDEEDIIDAICHDSDARKDIIGNDMFGDKSRLLKFTGTSVSSLIESVDLDTLNYIKSFDYEDVYMVHVKVKEFAFSTEDIYNEIKNNSYFVNLCKLFDDNNIEYDKMDITDFFFMPIDNGDTKEEFIDTAIESLQDYFDNENAIKFIAEHEKDILHILNYYYCDELADSEDDDDDDDDWD